MKVKIMLEVEVNEKHYNDIMEFWRVKPRLKPEHIVEMVKIIINNNLMYPFIHVKKAKLVEKTLFDYVKN